MSHSNFPSPDESQVEEVVQVTFDSEGSCVKGWFYPAKGVGPFPTAVLLHSFPGNDQSPPGLGPALMRAGVNALAFNYRGTWGSKGLYTLSTSIADVHSALLYLKSTAVVRDFAVDTTRIALVGYSYGSGIALISALATPQIQKVAYIAGAHLCEIARQTAQNDRFKEFFLNLLQEEITTS